jgi:hypothetical protein
VKEITRPAALRPVLFHIAETGPKGAYSDFVRTFFTRPFHSSFSTILLHATQQHKSSAAHTHIHESSQANPVTPPPVAVHHTLHPHATHNNKLNFHAHRLEEAIAATAKLSTNRLKYRNGRIFVHALHPLTS